MSSPNSESGVAVQAVTAPPAQKKRPDLWLFVRLGIYAVCLVWMAVSFFFLWQSGFGLADMLRALWVPAIFLIQFAVLTTPWRAVKAKDLVRMFLLGMGLVFFAALLTEIVITDAIENVGPVYALLTQESVLGPALDVMSGVASPVVEEIFKPLPAVLFILIAGRGYWKRALGPLDIGLLAGASGAGFLFMENLARVAGGWTRSMGWDRTWDSASFGINPFFIFPEMVHGDFTVWPGHAEMALFIGLCLGFGLLLRKKLPVVWMALPAAGMLWMMWLHFLQNYLEDGHQQAWALLVKGLHLNGGLAQYFMILALLLALGFSMYTKYQYLKKDPEATLKAVGKETLEYVKANKNKPLLILQKLWSLRHFWTYRHAVAYGVYNARQQTEAEQEKWVPWLYDLRQRALGKL